MTTRADINYQIYPAKYFRASPTNFAWNALTAHDVHHALQTRPGFEGQSLYFILNHPIKYVRIVGLIVDIELLGQGRYLLLTLDDGSGSTIDCKVEVRQPEKEGYTGYRDRVKQEWPSTTLVDNLDVFTTIGTTTVQIDKSPIDIGTVINAKGTIDTFRQHRQLKLEIVRIVRDTNAEAQAWKKTAEWKSTKLSTPWVLSAEARAKVDEELALEKAKEVRKARRKRAWDAKYEVKRREHEERKEVRRRKLEGKFDAGALVRSAVLPEPWD